MSTGLGAPANVPQKQSKHSAIMDVTDRVLRQIGELEDLLAEISPRPQKEEVKSSEKQPPASLSDFLNTEAGRLDLAASRLSEAVGELRDLLF